MSTNPFRRSSLKDSVGSHNSYSIAAHVVDEIGSQNASAEPLSINTKAHGSAQKHVNFASPPAIPISPASYPPSSPESLRISPAFASAQPVSPETTGYSEALQSDPFHAEAKPDEDDGAIQQALQNAKANLTIVARDPQQEKEEAVRRTLSKFASAPRRVPDKQQHGQSTSGAQRQTMDVDAFKRLLLTGDSGQVNSKHPVDGVSASSLRTPSDDSSSSDDEDDGSSPEQSDAPFQNRLTIVGSSNLSSEVDQQDGQPSSMPAEAQSKPKPPPPKSRHGKSIVDKPSTSVAGLENRPSSIRTSSNSSISPGLATPDSGNTPKKAAPPPPLSRRKSQAGVPSRSKSTRQSMIVDQEQSSPSLETASRPVQPPPPPPTRRPNSVIIRHPVMDLPTTAEEPDATESTSTASRKPSDAQSIPLPATSHPHTKRMSMTTSNAPAAPPPRRGRGSSRSSIDSPRLGVAAVSNNVASTRSSGEYVRPETVDVNSVATSNASDILADLAALQQEVDAARRSVPG